jgi:hypothetical protein
MVDGAGQGGLRIGRNVGARFVPGVSGNPAAASATPNLHPACTSGVEPADALRPVTHAAATHDLHPACNCSGPSAEAPPAATLALATTDLHSACSSRLSVEFDLLLAGNLMRIATIAWRPCSSVLLPRPFPIGQSASNPRRRAGVLRAEGSA